MRAEANEGNLKEQTGSLRRNGSVQEVCPHLYNAVVWVSDVEGTEGGRRTKVSWPER